MTTEHTQPAIKFWYQLWATDSREAFVNAMKNLEASIQADGYSLQSDDIRFHGAQADYFPPIAKSGEMGQNGDRR